MATSPAPPASTSASAPPNFYAQAASAQPPAQPAKPDHTEDNQKFRRAVEKLLTVFSQMEKLKPQGKDISKQLKAMAQSLKDTQSEVFEGMDGAGDEDLDLEKKPQAQSAAGGGAAGPAAPATAQPGGTGA